MSVFEKDGVFVLDDPAFGGALLIEGGGRSAPGTKSSNPTVKPEYETGEIAMWGSNNDFPKTLRDVVEGNSIIGPTIKFKQNALYGKGLGVFMVDGRNDDGSEKLVPAYIEEVEEFLERTQIRRYLLEAIEGLYYFNNFFPEIILNKDRSKIVQLSCQDAMFCRWEKMDKRGNINHCYISGNWPDPAPEELEKVKSFDPYNPMRVELLREDKEFKYIYRVSSPSPGRIYYPLPEWYATVKSGWVDVANAIPKFKKAILKNQIAVKYIIHVPKTYWEDQIEGYNDMDAEKQAQERLKRVQAINDWLASEINAGKSIVGTYDVDHNKKEFGKIQIEVIKANLSEGAYNEDSQEASTHLLFGQGVDPTLMGNSPGKGMGAGSGSDKRVAFNVYNATHDPDRDLILEVLYLISKYNGWDPRIRFALVHADVNTLDTGKPTSTSA